MVYRLTKSELLLGVVGFASDIPVFFLVPVAGVLADKFKRHYILAITQALAALQALNLTVEHTPQGATQPPECAHDSARIPAGASYGRKAHRTPPAHVDQTYDAPLPGCCPDCGGRVALERYATQY